MYINFKEPVYNILILENILISNIIELKVKESQSQEV